MSANGIPRVVQGYEPRPFEQWIAEAKELGFEMVYDLNPEEFVVQIALKPRTRKAKTALDRALDDWCGQITATHTYDKRAAEMLKQGIAVPSRPPTPKEFRIALDDAAAYALQMARAALSGRVA